MFNKRKFSKDLGTFIDDSKFDNVHYNSSRFDDHCRTDGGNKLQHDSHFKMNYNDDSNFVDNRQNKNDNKVIKDSSRFGYDNKINYDSKFHDYYKSNSYSISNRDFKSISSTELSDYTRVIKSNRSY